MSDRMDILDALRALDSRTSNAQVEAVLWDAEARALSFRRVAGYEHINVWFPAERYGDIVVERNNGPGGANPVVLWEMAVEPWSNDHWNAGAA